MTRMAKAKRIKPETARKRSASRAQVTEAAAVPTRKVDNLLDELNRVQERVTERAYEIFKTGGARIGAALEDWLSAERLTVWRPAIEIVERNGHLIVRAAVAGLEPGDLDIQVTPDTVLLRAAISHEHSADEGAVHMCEFQPGQLFRLIPLPASIDPDMVTAEYRNGLVTVTAGLAQAPETRRLEITET